ncbi:MAG: hypothetical protein SGJ27_28600 [Candidatus Melainabacteria bacterium]|nr:hypothetical protein [Candidatus Melainabacteria bacterium]
MDRNLEKFDFQATLRSVGEAVVSVICHILFDFALVGIAVAAVLATCALVLSKRKHHFARPFYVVARRIATACAALAVPGLAYLVFTGHLPDSGVYLNFSFGFLVLWSMVTIYLCAEEMNFEWFTSGEQSPQVIEDETAIVSSSVTPGVGDLKSVRVEEAVGDVTLKLSREEQNAVVGDVTLKLSREEQNAVVGDVTLKLSREEQVAGDVTLKIPREEQVAGDVTVKIPSEEQTAGASSMKSSEEETTVGDVTVKIERGHELPDGDVALRK